MEDQDVSGNVRPRAAMGTIELPVSLVQAARDLNVSAKTVRAWRDDGEIDVFRPMKRKEFVFLSDLVRLIRSRRVHITPHAESRVAEILDGERQRASGP